MTDSCGWTPELLHQHFLAVMGERDKRIAEQFRSIDSAAQLLAQQLLQYKADQNEWGQSFRDVRSSYVTIDTWDAKHQQVADKIESEVRIRNTKIEVVKEGLEEKLDQVVKLMTQRNEMVDRERNVLSTAVTELKSRVGFIPTSIILASVSLLITLIGMIGELVRLWR